MGFLRRLTGHDAGAPEWCTALGGDGYRQLVEIVARQLGSRDMAGTPAEVWWPRQAAEVIGLPVLAARLATVPRGKWEAVVRIYYAKRIAQREAGDRVEAAAGSLEQATPDLRLLLMREEVAPPGDVRYPGPLPGTVEILALDTKVSDRFVSERLAAGWNAPLETIHAAAEAQVLRLSIEEADRGSIGRPAVRGFSIEKHGGYIGPIVRHLAKRLPDAVGPFGAYVGVPGPGGLFVRPLAAGLDLRGDLADVAALTHLVHEKARVRIAAIPFWIRPTGEIVSAPLRLDSSGMVLGSHYPGLAGVLAALDPLEFLEVPGWAQGKLTPEQYVRFAGCVSATLGYATPEEVAKLGSALNLAPLAELCGAAPFATWLSVVDEHVRRSQDDAKDVKRLAIRGIEDPDATLAGLVTWIEAPASGAPTMVTRPVGGTGFVEVLGVVANGQARAIDAAVAEGVGHGDDLFDRGRAAIRAGLSVSASKAERLSGVESHVVGFPSPTAAIPHLLTWLPEVTGPYGALIAVGDASRLDVLPVYDASVVLDLPAMLGAAAGAALTAEWAVPPSVFWLSPSSLDVLHVERADGIMTGVTSSADIAGIVARLPIGPRQLPPGLEAILGPDGSVRFYGLLHAAVVERLSEDPAGLAELWVPLIREVAARCRSQPPADWAREIRAWMDEISAPRGELDRLALSPDYAVVEPALCLRVARRDLAGSQLARDAGGGLVSFPAIAVGGRYRRVTHAMLQRWRVEADRCHQDAALQTALAPDILDEPMFPDQPSVRELYSRELEREAAGLCLHLRYPGSRRGFVVSITHGSRAHYVRLDDPGAIVLIPGFAHIIAGIYARADDAADAHSSWLVWLTPDGRVVDLFDTTRPLPQPDQLPAEFRAMVQGDGPTRLN